MAMVVHESPDMTKLWPVRKRLRRDSPPPSATAAAVATTTTTRTTTRTNGGVSFRVHSKWRQHGASEKGASPARFDYIPGDDDRKRVGVIFTGRKARPRARRRRLLSRITASTAFPIQQCPYQRITAVAGQTQEGTEEKAAALDPSDAALPMAGIPICYEGQATGVADPLWIIRRLPAPLELPASPVNEVLEAELRLLFDEMVRSGESVFRFCTGPAPGSEHIECSDMLTAWVFRLLKKGAGDKVWQERIERLVYKVLFEYIMKLPYEANCGSGGRISAPFGAGECTNGHEKMPKEPLLDMLTWLKGVAMGVYNPRGSGTLWGQECSEWQHVNISSHGCLPPTAPNYFNLNECPGLDNVMHWWKMVLCSREELFVKPNDLLPTEDFPYHLKSESADSLASTNEMPMLPRRRLLRSLALLKLSDCHRKRVPIGPSFQADVPEWKGPCSGRVLSGEDEDSRWLGTQIWPIECDLREAEAGQETIGKGRVESCVCPFPRSVSCVRYHVSMGRHKMRRNFGQAFKGLGLNEMGEQVSNSWTKDEESIFGALVKLNPLSKYKSFWEPALKFFGSKSSQKIVSYYFNVFVPRRMGIQTRFLAGDADSDDDEAGIDGYEDLYPMASTIWYS